jgi:hypothetical protein
VEGKGENFGLEILHLDQGDYILANVMLWIGLLVVATALFSEGKRL